MEFGFFMRGQFPAGDDMHQRFNDHLAQARLADRLGYAYLAKGQHYSSTPWQAFQVVPFLSRIMAEAPNAKLVTGIVLLSLHKPLDIAEQLASIDVMSGGRLVFGSGLGYRDVEFKAFGTASKDKVRRFEENLEAIRRLWTEESVSMRASHFELDGASCTLKPLQKPRPPFWIGANADAAVRRAARMADSWFINPHQRMDTIARQLDVYRQALDEVGKPLPKVLPIMRECFVARSREEAIRSSRPYLEKKYKSYHDWGQDKAMPKGDDNLSLDFDELARDRFLFGSPDEVAEQIIGYRRRLGINTVFIAVQWIGMPQSQVVDTITMFAEEVMPKVRQGV